MIKVLFFSLTPDYHIVNIDLYLVMDHIMEQCYHSMLIGCPSIVQPKWHKLVAESAPLCNGSSLLHVFRCHFDLIITREFVHEGEYLMLCSVVNQNINVGSGKSSLGITLFKSL